MIEAGELYFSSSVERLKETKLDLDIWRMDRCQKEP